MSPQSRVQRAPRPPLLRQADAADASLPRGLAGWQCQRLLGAGELTKVFAAWAQTGPRDSSPPYALKMLREPWDADPRAIKLLRREAWIGQHVSHPHLVPLLAAELTKPPYFLVMPLLRGCTLAQLTTTRDLLSLPVTLWIGRQLAEGLTALDDAGWIHGDIKPANTFVSPEMHVTLLDLGFARPKGQTARLADRPLMGTARYMSPEMFSATAAIDIRSDIYSLGVMLFELLTGRPPFEAEEAAQLALQHREELPARLRHRVATVPKRVARLVQTMLAKEPLRRPQSPRELVAQLAALEIDTLCDRFVDECGLGPGPKRFAGSAASARLATTADSFDRASPSGGRSIAAGPGCAPRERSAASNLHSP